MNNSIKMQMRCALTFNKMTFVDPRSYADRDLHFIGRRFLASSPRRFEHHIGVINIPRAWQAFVRLLVF